MSCSKGSKGGGGWPTWSSQGGKGEARGKGKGHKGQKGGYVPNAPAEDARMRGDSIYQKYMDAGDPPRGHHL